MVLPVNVDTVTVVGSFVRLDGTPAVGTVTFTPVPARLLDASADPPTTILGTPIVVDLDEFGALSVELPATDDVDLNPVDWAYHVSIRLGADSAYSFCMTAAAGTTVDLAVVTPIYTGTGDPIVAGPPGVPGADGPPGEGVPPGGATGELLAKLSSSDFDTDWVPASAPGVHASTHAVGSTDPVTLAQSQVTGLAAHLATLDNHVADTTGIHGIANTATLETTSGAQARVDAHVNDTTAAHAATAIAYSGSTNLSATTVEAALDELDTEKASTATFTSSTAGLAPASGGGTANYLRADGTWVAPPGSFAGVGNTATFSYNATTTEPPTGNQLRLNSTTFSAATRLWVMQTTVDGLDVSVGLARILAGHQIYFQDRDNAANWVKYNVTADGVDDGAYYDFTVAYHSGPGGIPAGQVELQAIAPGTVGVPPGGTSGQVLTKDSSADYDVSWAAGGGGGGGITTEDAVDAVAASLSAGTGGVGVQVTYDDALNEIALSINKSELALDQVNNTSDAAKPVSTATQTALDTKPSSTTVDTIWTGNAAAYAAIGTKDSATLYFVTA